ncbi:MAG: DUF3052 domain-containing protein [Flavobacteriaceae bacterium]
MSSAGYSGTPLAKKLGIKEGQSVILVNPPEHYFELFESFPQVEFAENGKESIDFIHLFCSHLEELEKDFNPLKKALKKNGSLWVSWPKGSSKLPKDLDGNIVRRYGLSNGLVDVKVCAVDADWSGLKFMYRLKDRKK